MKNINQIGYTDETTYYPPKTYDRTSQSNFDSVLQSETIIYAQPESVVNQATTSANIQTVTSPTELESIFQRAANQYGLDINLLKAVAKTESNFNSNATSSVGAMGIMQLMPDTAKYLGVNDAYNPEENIMGGAKYLSQMLKKYNGNISYALAAYNAGPGNVDKYNGIPPFEETQNYVKKITALLGTASTQDTTQTVATTPATSDVSIIYAVAANDVTNPSILNQL